MPEPAEHLVKLIGFPTEAGAASLKTLLGEAGIRAVIDGTMIAGFRAEAPGEVRVMIAERDLSQAKSILEKFQQGNEEIDWSQVDVGDPVDDSEGGELAESRSIYGATVLEWIAVVSLALFTLAIL